MANARDHIRIRVMLDEKTFTDFARFNTFKLQKSMKQPLRFCAVMLVFSLICIVTGRPQSITTAALLSLAGVGMPVYQQLRFKYSTRKSIRTFGLPREAYELVLGEREVSIQSLAQGGNTASLKWKEFHHVYRVDGCIYLFAMPQRAFLLPDGQAEDADADELWKWITRHMNKDKVSDMR